MDVFSSQLPFKAGLVKSSVRESEQSPRPQEALFAAMVRNASRSRAISDCRANGLSKSVGRFRSKNMLFSIAAQKRVRNALNRINSAAAFATDPVLSCTRLVLCGSTFPRISRC